jgi:hypothetical protein
MLARPPLGPSHPLLAASVGPGRHANPPSVRWPNGFLGVTAPSAGRLRWRRAEAAQHGAAAGSVHRRDPAAQVAGLVEDHAR